MFRLQTLADTRRAAGADQAWQEARARNACMTTSITRNDDGPTEKELCELLGDWMDNVQTGYEDLTPLCYYGAFLQLTSTTCLACDAGGECASSGISQNMRVVSGLARSLLPSAAKLTLSPAQIAALTC